MFSNGPSRNTRPLPTQFSATPPAKTRLLMPVSAWTCRVVRSMTSSVHRLHRGRQVHLPLRHLRLGLSGRPAQELVELPRGHGQSLAIVEVAHVEPIGAVLLEINDLLEQGVSVDRPAVWSEPHHLVLATVDSEAGVVGKRRVKQAQRMREAELSHQLDAIAPADPETGGRPFADAVEGDERRLLEGRRKKRAGRVRLVVVGEDVPSAIPVGQTVVHLAGQMEFLLEPERHRLAKGAEPGRCVGEVGLQQPLELGERFVVKADVIELLRLQPGLVQAELDRRLGEAVVVLFTGESFLFWAAATISPSTTNAAAES